MSENDDLTKEVPINESYDLLQKSMNNLNVQQSSGSLPPELYPSANNQGVQPAPPNPQSVSTGHEEDAAQKE